VESEPQRGTTFIIELPASSPPQIVPPAASQENKD